MLRILFSNSLGLCEDKWQKYILIICFISEKLTIKYIKLHDSGINKRWNITDANYVKQLNILIVE